MKINLLDIQSNTMENVPGQFTLEFFGIGQNIPNNGIFLHLRDFGPIYRGRSSLLMSIEPNLPRVRKKPRKTPLKDRLYRIARIKKEVNRERYFANDVSGPISPRAYDNPLGISKITKRIVKKRRKMLLI